MCERCKELRHEIYKLRDENTVLHQRVLTAQLESDLARATNTEVTFLTLEQVCKYLQLSDVTVKKYIKSGSLEAINTAEKGGIYRISYKALLAFIKHMTVEKLEVCKC